MPQCSVLKTDGSCELQQDTRSGSASPTPGNRPGKDVKINAAVGINSPNIYGDVFNIQHARPKTG